MAAVTSTLTANSKLASRATDEPPGDNMPAAMVTTHAKPGDNMPAAMVTSPAKTGVVHFLFLLRDALPHVALWRRFFAGARDASLWRAWAHCVHYTSFVQSNLTSQFPGLHWVGPVKTQICKDLVTAEAALMRAALQGSDTDAPTPPGAVEKFVLLGESTLPVKPFVTIHAALISSDQSDFCLYSPRNWRKTVMQDEEMLLVKHSQWVVLNRKHARQFSQQFSIDHSTHRWNVAIHSKNKKWAGVNVMVDQGPKKDRCTDECAVFGTLFGLFLPGKGGVKVCPLNKTTACTSTKELMRESRCRTLNVVGQQANNLMDEIRADADSKVGPKNPHWHESLEFSRLGTSALRALRASPYLFARRFPFDAELAHYADILLDETPH